MTAKDIILAIIARIGVGGGTGHVLEYTGSAIRALDMEARMTICNMSIEAGARGGHDRAGRNHLRLPGRAAIRTPGRGLGRGGRTLAQTAHRSRRRL